MKPQVKKILTKLSKVKVDLTNVNQLSSLVQKVGLMKEKW